MKKPLLIVLCAFVLVGCTDIEPSSNQRMNEIQEKHLQESVSQLGLPAITNWREKRTFKMIYELRDKTDLVTYTYITAQASGDLKFLCESIGFPINDATGYSSPENVSYFKAGGAIHVIPLQQAEPNGLFTPPTSNSYWVMCIDKIGGKPAPVFIAGSPVVSTFPLK